MTNDSQLPSISPSDLDRVTGGGLLGDNHQIINWGSGDINVFLPKPDKKPDMVINGRPRPDINRPIRTPFGWPGRR